MLSLADFLCREFQYGPNGCSSLMREFYALNFGIEVPDVAWRDGSLWHR